MSQTQGESKQDAAVDEAQMPEESKPLVLVCDDERPIRNVMRNFLEKNRFRVLEASNGQTALALARQNHPDLILLDSMMPHLSGLDCLATLRKEPRTARTPVIMVTAKKDAGYIRECMKHGIQGYIGKPFEMNTLVQKIRGALTTGS